MTHEPADVDLDKPVPGEPESLEPEPVAPRNRRPAALFVVAALLMIALAAGYVFLSRGTSAPPAAVETTKPAEEVPVAQAEPAEQIFLPPLDETDTLVRELVGRLSTHPTVAAWLTTDGLILNFVVVTSRIANGETPAVELKSVGPVPAFRTRTSGDNLYIDPSSYRRYDRYAEAISALDARGTARLYTTIKPRVVDAHRRLGRPDTEFDSVLERAIAELLRVPAVEGDVAVEPQGIVYGFADPRLEQMSAAQKQLFRMGPQNVRAVQRKLREIAQYLGIPSTRLPPG